MIPKSLVKPLLKRLLILGFISAAVVLAFSEIAYLLQREETSRAPREVELVIPGGTAARVAAGDIIPSIPSEMVFMVGDTLVVKNEDETDHQLGPLWIPPGKSASMVLDQANEYAYTCSFQPSNYLGFTVRQAVTWRARLSALFYGTPPTLIILLVYSFILYPIKATREESLPVVDKAGG